jgi:hypothetical protein
LGKLKISLQKCGLQLRDGVTHKVTHKFCEEQEKRNTTKHFIEIAPVAHSGSLSMRSNSAT